MRLVVSRRAEQQLTEIERYIARDRPRAAAKVIASIRSSAGLLAAQPEMGRAVPGENFREWPVPRLPYIITYRPDAARAALVILAVFHGAQDRRR